MRSIDNIPRAASSSTSATDDATKKKILDIIDHQFDLEIYLKHREAATIRREIEKAEDTLRDLKLAIDNVASAATLASALYQSYLPNGPKAQQVRGQVLYGRRSDGVFVRLSCPACKREDFANRQGFLNHCRLAHDLEFGPYEQTMLRCGTPVDESEVPLDDPARVRPVTMPIPPVKPKKKERPTIKVFEEDVDLETDKVPQSDDATPTPPPPHPIQASKSLPETAPAEVPPTPTRTEEPKPMESFAAAMSSASTPTSDSGSRFYIKKQVVVGNVSKFILPEKRDPTLKDYTHKWMVYVVEPPQAQEVAKFITGVRFHLHPSYKPRDVVDVTEPPFRLTRLGWGEFPIRVQLFFVDKKRNKSVDIIHQVKVQRPHLYFDDVSSTPAPLAPIEFSAGISKSQAAAIASKQKMSLLHGILKDSVRLLPIIRPASQTASSLPYICATGIKQYFGWSVGRRKALEQRAVDTLDEVLRSAAAALSTKDVVLWCRENRFTPRRADVDDSKGEEMASATGVGYCWDNISEGDDMDVDIGDSGATEEGSDESKQAGQSLITLIRENLEQGGLVDEGHVDWIWSVIAQLRLKGVIANDMIEDRDGMLRGPTRDFDIIEAMDQRLVTGNLLVQIAKVFLRRLIKSSLEVYEKQREQEQQGENDSDKILVPIHIYQGAQQDPNFDVLTNQYMGPPQGDTDLKKAKE
ncbi:yeats family-domain-containing protein [Fennellomyces sp. T-0311]|nr:yeats family-domain-containing protein [Fennellomyces sp. T-0311]